MFTLETSLSALLIVSVVVNVLLLPAAATTVDGVNVRHERRFKAYKIVRITAYVILTLGQAASFAAGLMVTRDGFSLDDMVGMAAVVAYAASTVGGSALQVVT